MNIQTRGNGSIAHSVCDPLNFIRCFLSPDSIALKDMAKNEINMSKSKRQQFLPSLFL